MVVLGPDLLDALESALERVNVIPAEWPEPVDADASVLSAGWVRIEPEFRAMLRLLSRRQQCASGARARRPITGGRSRPAGTGRGAAAALFAHPPVLTTTQAQNTPGIT